MINQECCTFKRPHLGWSKILMACFVGLLLGSAALSAQVRVTGSVKDKSTGEGLILANVVLKGTTVGIQTDFDGNFALSVPQDPPFTLVVSYLGYDENEVEVTDASQVVKFKMVESGGFDLEAVEVKASRITEKTKESAQTIEALDIIAIKETPAANFYDGLGALKGVDLTTASLGFTIINTRGFNSTSPVRSLQTIDGVDNQAPGLNFSLGNFLGSPELDVQKVNIVVGANSAYYGPNAFNGVIAMNTKDPFLHQGLSVSIKKGERQLWDGGIRYARAFANKDGKEKFAFKINASYMQAYDWEADNFDEVYQEDPENYVGIDNPGRYDAVNIYGDESFSTLFQATTLDDTIKRPGLGRFYRTGYRESDIVNYNTKNLKLSGALHYKITSKTELITGFNYGTGTTVYQGDNRFSLNGLKFYQGKVELRQKDKFFLRAYATQEDAGNTYDAYFTALKLLERAKPDEVWATEYKLYWSGITPPGVDNYDLDPIDSLRAMGYPGLVFGPQYPLDSLRQILADPETINLLGSWHEIIQEQVDNNLEQGAIDQQAYLVPGTPEFEAAKEEIIGKTHLEGGTGFYDKSALYHVHGEYTFNPTFTEAITVGANFRQYTPDSRRTIFAEPITLDTTFNAEGEVIEIDTTIGVIRNSEFGVYGGIEKRLVDNRLKLNATLRMDKNQNFNLLFSPAASAVYTHNPDNIVRLSFSSAIRNPTLTDQYLRYNVGRAILVGNIDGFEDLVTLDSFNEFRKDLDTTSLDYFDVPAIQPEKVISAELGYRTTIASRVYVDASYYFSMYRDFIGYNIGLQIAGFDDVVGLPQGLQVYRVAANAKEVVTTQGFSIGVNYYFSQYFGFAANYSWNRLNTSTDDPIVPAFNTPEHKYNVGINGRNIVWELGNIKLKNWGFNFNYKWVQGFLNEGSPQFTGEIPSYGLLDGQVNWASPKLKTTFKIGASNLLNNKQFQVYGGPRIGRMAYISAVVELKKL